MLEQTDYRKNQPHYRYVSACDEGFTERGDYCQRAEAARDSRGEPGDGHDEQRIDSENESDDYDCDAD